MALKIPAGIDGIPTTTIPNDPAQFVQWFKSIGIKRWLANADVRNAQSGAGVTITGTVATPATISYDDSGVGLFTEPYVLLGNPAAGATLTAYRSLAAEAGILTITDGGATRNVTVGVALNGIGDAQLRQGAANSVIGNAAGSTADVADIAATADGQVLQRISGALAFGTLAAGSLAAISNDTVLGNISGGAAAPSALTQAQLTTLINSFSSSLSGAVPASGGGTTNFMRADGSWAAPAYSAGANPSANVGLSAVNGSSANFMRADGAPALSQGITPTWTAAHIWSSTATFNGAVSFSSSVISTGVTGGAQGSNTINCAGLYVNGTAVATAVGANPSAKVGLSVVNGSAATWMRSDGAPQLDVSIAPTWTGGHTFNIGITLASIGTGAANANGVLNGGSTVETYQNNATYGSSVTSTAIGYLDAPSTSAASFAITALRGFQHNDVSIGSGSSVTTQIGFFCSAMTGASNNRAFVGQVASAANAYNLYMQGTALNYLAGKLLIGSSSDSGGGEILQVTGTASVSGSVGFNGNAPPTQPTGYGTPTNGALISSINGTTTYTVVQLAAYLAQLVLDLKKYGLLAA